MNRTETIPQFEPKSATRPSVAEMASVKIRPHHHDRLAIVYVRQSSPKQVLENRESTARQYAFAEHAVALGWPRERVLIIDEDLGKSVRTTEGRSGFQRLVTEVTLNHVGLVLGLEMSRLARSSKVWHAFFEMCALFGTLIADEDGVYDGHDPNDRMLLGLKGIISEMELHTMRNRLNQGLMNKARRGKLFMRAPIGYVRLTPEELALDPDEQVQSVVQLIFDKFTELQSVSRVLKYLLANGIRIGVRRCNGRVPDSVEWCRPVHGTLLRMIHNPTYAGAYTMGRRTNDPRRRGPKRCRRVDLPMDEWKVLLHDTVPAYITWKQYLANQERWKTNYIRLSGLGSVRNGNALLPGLLICGHCGAHLVVHYQQTAKYRYSCLRQSVYYGEKSCQSVKGSPLDAIVVEKVLRVLEPAALELSLQAAEDIQNERQRLHANWQQRRERARYETDRAARLYHANEPENRLVGRELEKRWETALRDQQRLEEEYDRFCHDQPLELTAVDRDRIRELAATIPVIWNAAETTPQDRKTIMRSLVDRVVVKAQGTSEYVDVTIHWAGGYVSEYEIIQPVGSFGQLRDSAQLKKRIIELHLEGWTHQQIADRLNQEKFHPATGGQFNGNALQMFLRTHCREELKLDQGPYQEYLRPNEWLVNDLSRALNTPQATLQYWSRRGWVRARQLKGSGRWIFWADADDLARLQELRACPVNYHPRNEPYPAKLITPKVIP